MSTGSSSDSEIKSAYLEYKDLRGLLGSSNMFGEGVPNFTEAIPEPKEGNERVFKKETTIRGTYDL